MTSLKDIRRTFLDFFADRGHTVVESAPLVPHNDPTLMFTNAGMVPFKNVFTGLEKRDYLRAVSSQKCVRAGGKHNDLDNVGYTARHHTFFEMLGNFSFGDYFKAVAIEHAWDLVTKVYGLPAEKLLVTVYSEDDEAFDLWRKIAGLDERRILRIPTSDNFWSMGDTGPCGPCSEIFYDHGPHIPGGPPGSPDADGDRFIEIWNLVFMQFEQLAPGDRRPLPKPSIDTGMGLERLAAVLQGVHDNYDTDLFRTLIAASVSASGAAASGAHAVSHRVIADHLRSCSFLIADGVLPSNEGRGYVLRRIMRRAMRHAHIIGAREPLMHRLVPTLVAEMGSAFPELVRAQALIQTTLQSEETRFRQTLERGLKLLDEAIADVRGNELPGEVAFKLYDTYGFPLDLTEDALRIRNISVDRAGFDAAMDRQRREARASWAGSGEAATEQLWFEIRDEVGPTEFLGYDRDRAEGVVAAIVKAGARADAAEAGEEVDLVVNQTPFYAESGGQVGDRGSAWTAAGTELAVSDTLKKLGNLFVHRARIERGRLAVGDALTLAIDKAARTRTRANHSATHLLHEALRRVLGPHVAQKGSLVAPDRLRFDFSHPKPMTAEEIAEVETIVNQKIRENEEVSTRLMTPDAAIEAGAMALFGEKYGDEVRVLTMASNDADEPWTKGHKAFSMELCGGTHVRRLGDIALFKVVGESAVASGVRRVEAVTGEAARAWLEAQAAPAREAAAALKAPLPELPARVVSLMEEKKRLERELSDAKRALALGGGQAAGPAVREIGGLKLIAEVVSDVPVKELRPLIDESKARIGSGIVAFVAVNDGKAAVAVGVTPDLVAGTSAVDLVKRAVAVLGGQGGGGRPDFAQGGGPDADKAQAAVEEIVSSVTALAGAA